MKKEESSRSFVKFSLWFIFLSTLGVGGGVFFLLSVVVPIEQWYVDRGWSQFKIDSVMKYYVIGWIVFGFFLSYLFHRFILRNNYWKVAYSVVFCSILLCGVAMYYFLNTGTGLVQHSQGNVQQGERFTFGPYPERDDLAQLKEEGYDGVITLLSPTLPIEKPLLDKEVKNAEEVGMELHSLPMLPWVGDNSESIQQAKTLIVQDEKKYYVHCYLGRHRVDVIKQVINQELGQDYEVMFLQPTTFERGSLYYFDEKELLIGPYPTDEEWFTRIKRAEVEEVVSMLQPTSEKWLNKEKEVTSEMNISFTSMPVSSNTRLEDIKRIADYVASLDHKVFVHGFNSTTDMDMLEAYISWGKTLTGTKGLSLESGEHKKVGEKVLIGYPPTDRDKQMLSNVGVEELISLDTADSKAIYKQLKRIKDQKKLSYVAVSNQETLDLAEKITRGLLYGSTERGKDFESIVLTEGPLIRHERNLIIGPVLTEDEYDSFALKSGVAQIIFLYSSSISSRERLEEVKSLASDHSISLHVIPMHEGYEEELIPLIQAENGLNYIMTEEQLMTYVNDFIKQF